MTWIMRTYYGLRRSLGFEEIPAERLRKQMLLTPDRDCGEVLRQEDQKKLQRLLLCLGAGILLTGAVAWKNHSSFLTTLIRPGYGENDAHLLLDLDLEEEEYRIPLALESLRYSPEELPEVFQQAEQLVLERARKGNPDWRHISQDLDFREETGVPGITVTWISRDIDRIAADGTVSELAQGAEPVPVSLQAVLHYEEETWETEVEAVLVPPQLSAAGAMERQLRELLMNSTGDRQQWEISLPQELEGRQIRYRSQGDSTPLWVMPLLVLVLAICLWQLPEQRRREALKTRERELALEYSELVWKLTVLLGAGLTVKGAWERILGQYQQKRREGGRLEPLYEEMQMTWNSMNQGTYEEKAYVEFGRRCGLAPYLRLGSLLESNLRQGRKGMRKQMQDEADAAFRERLQLARRQGEEASSRLLLPMMILFGLVLLILMVPALLTLG